VSQQFSRTLVQLLPAACVVDIIPPTFSGIGALVPVSNGSLSASWLAAVGTPEPIEYLVYLNKLTDDVNDLFSSNNLLFITRNLSASIFQEADFGLLQGGTAYRVGVRAKDSVGNIETNQSFLVAISSGVATESLSEFIKVVKAVMANQASNISSEVESDEVISKLETQEIVSKVTVDPDIKC